MREDVAFKSSGSVMASERLESTSRFRATLGLGLLLLGFAAVGLKLVSIQILHHSFWVAYVDDQRKTAITIYPKRGTIYDRNRRVPLATSVVEEVLCVVPSRVTDPATLAKALSSYAQMSPRNIIEKIRNTNLYMVYLKRGFDLETAKEIGALNLAGVEFRSESSRRYPRGVVASNLLGFANIENKGLAGVEFRYDAHLAGEAGKQIIIKDSSRREIVALAQTVKEPRHGNHLILTIDEVIQYITEKALDSVVVSSSPESASAVVVNPKTGEIVAMACRPTFDPNKPSTYRNERLRNRPIADVFEPGSAFKPVAAAAALERKVISPTDRVYCELGKMRYHGHTFDDVHPFAEISFADVIAQSSNIGMIKVVSLLEPQWLYTYIKSFGFGALTGVDLPGESGGIVHPPSRWSGLSMGSIPIGQEIGVTALQLATAFSAIANGGMLIQPYVVSEIVGPDGETLARAQVRPVRHAIKPETARMLSTMLEQAVISGTGKEARPKGYRCAGKTGTAQKPDLVNGGYIRGKYIAVFAGFVPVDDPVACIVVVVDAPEGKYYGGQVAAPAFREIAQGILNYLEVPPSAPEEQVVSQPAKPPRKSVLVAKETSLEAATSPASDGVPRMPDVRGMTMRETMEALSAYSLLLDFDGSGVAVRQHPAPGEKIESGRRCQIAFKRKESL